MMMQMKRIFPAGALNDEDEPDAFFTNITDATNRITLLQTKAYETRIKAILTEMSSKFPAEYEQLRKSFSAGAINELEKNADVSSQLYGVVSELQRKDLLPAVAFQLSTFGAFQMFKSLLRTVETEQNKAYPDWRAGLVKIAEENERLRKIAAGKADKNNDKEGEEDAQDGHESGISEVSERSERALRKTSIVAMNRNGYRRLYLLVN